MSMVDPSILNTEAYAILSDEVFNAFKEGPEYESAVFKRIVMRKDPTRYAKEFLTNVVRIKLNGYVEVVINI